MIDTHAHLGDDAADVIERARIAGVSRIVTVATTLAGAYQALALAEEHVGVYASLGIHPHEAASFDLGRLAELGALLARRTSSQWGRRVSITFGTTLPPTPSSGFSRRSSCSRSRSANP